MRAQDFLESGFIAVYHFLNYQGLKGQQFSMAENGKAKYGQQFQTYGVFARFCFANHNGLLLPKPIWGRIL